MYQFIICVIGFFIAIILLTMIACEQKHQTQLMMQGKNKAKRIAPDHYYDLIREKFPKAKEMYESMIIDQIGREGLNSLLNANYIRLKNRTDDCAVYYID